jgi:hypothetical protein
LSANVAVSGDDYDVISSENIDLIYASEYKDLSKKVINDEEKIISKYEKSYGYKLDDTLYLGLLSSNNEVANAFSTQMPLNLQMNFPAGALNPDYFATKSWIKTLLSHESAHNFQINPKKNFLSYYAHKFMKNSFYNSILVPIFPVPNIMCSPFTLEGNAVLNESWHNNGGRLYSGAMLALTTTQANAGYITAKRTYNQHLYFPYGTHNYIVGGFFQLFLAKMYGLDRTNSYFYNFSGQWIPIFTNSVFKDTFGKDYEELIVEFSEWMKSKNSGFKSTKGKLLTTSKSNVKLTLNKDEILFLTTDMNTYPKLNIVSKSSKKITKKETTLSFGRVFEVDGKFYSLSSSNISPTKIKVALFDEDGEALEGSLSKATQAISDDGKSEVYFDIPSSIEEPQAYVDGKFFGRVNSSIFRDKEGNLYYFKQEDKIRTLYKNHQKLYSFDGWYGFVCDKDESGVYFVANSKHGSSVFRYKDGSITRVIDGDDVIDAKLLSKKKMLVESVVADGVVFQEVSLVSLNEKTNYPNYFFEDKDQQDNQQEINTTKSKPYTPISQMHYSSLDSSMNYKEDRLDFDMSINFSDALMQNKLSLFSSKFDQDTIAGVGYDNSTYMLNFGIAAYGMLDHDQNISSREYGLNAYLKYPIFRDMYESLDSSLTYGISHDRDDKEPLVLSLAYSDSRHFGKSMYLNRGDFITASVGLDRDDKAAGIKYFRQRDLGSEFYMSFNLSGAVSEIKDSKDKRGIKIESYKNNLSNALNFEMPSLLNDIYVKQIIKAGVGIKRVFNFDKYFFTFPISLRREALYVKYNYYDLKFKDDFTKGYSEITTGIRADLLYFNTLALPFSMEYIYNPDLKESSDFRVLFDLVF